MINRGAVPRPQTAAGSRPLNEPLLPIGNFKQDAAELAEYQRNGSTGWRVVSSVMGVLAFVAVIVLAAVGLWRLQVMAAAVATCWVTLSLTQSLSIKVQQNDISDLDTRLTEAEDELVVHTNQIAALNATLIATVAQVAINVIKIAQLNATTISQGLRITSLENRTTHLEERLTIDEIILLGVIYNVTVLQIEMAQAIVNITVLQSEVTILQGNVSNHQQRLLVLEAEYIAQAALLVEIQYWLQQNLTIIDQRLDILNITYTVTGQGTALVTSGPALPSGVTWQTRHFRQAGLDIEYLWISTTAGNPTQIRLTGAGGNYSFQITNFTATAPFGVLPAPSNFLERPLGPYQQSKFLLQSFVPNPVVLSAAWDNVNVALNFRSNLELFDAVTIVQPLTFITGFL